MVIGEEPKALIMIVKFLVVNLPSTYNEIIKRSSLNTAGAVVSTLHQIINFPAW